MTVMHLLYKNMHAFLLWQAKKEAKKETNDSPYESLVLATSTYLKLTTTSTKYIMSSHPCDERRLSFSQKGSSENKASIQCPRFNVD